MSPARAQVRQEPAYDPDANQYPKALYPKEFLGAHERFKAAPDGPEKDKCSAQMHALIKVVEDPDEHDDWAKQGYKESPADHLPEGRDPRIHRGPVKRSAVPAIVEPEPEPEPMPFPKTVYSADGRYDIVQSDEEYQEALSEGWKDSPSDHLPKEKDPRVPRAAKAKARGSKPTPVDESAQS